MPLDIATALQAADAAASLVTLRRSTVPLTSAAQWSETAWREEMKRRGWSVLYVKAPAGHWITQVPAGRDPLLVARVSARPLVYELPPFSVLMDDWREAGKDADAIILGRLAQLPEDVGDKAKSLATYVLIGAGIVAAAVLLGRR